MNKNSIVLLFLHSTQGTTRLLHNPDEPDRELYGGGRKGIISSVGFVGILTKWKLLVVDFWFILCSTV